MSLWVLPESLDLPDISISIEYKIIIKNQNPFYLNPMNVHIYDFHTMDFHFFTMTADRKKSCLVVPICNISAW